MPGGLHEVEADTVVGHVQDPVLARKRPRDTDGARLRVLVHVLQRLLHDAVHGELLHREETRVRRIEPARDVDTAAGFPLGGVVAHRLGETELGQLGRPEVVDHPAHRVERSSEPALEVRKLGAKGLPDLRRSTLGDALEVLDLEDRIRQNLRGTVVHIAIQAFALGLEAIEHPLRDLDRFVLILLRGGVDPRSEEIRGARLDVLHDELQLLEPAVSPLRRFVELAVRRASRTLLRLLLVVLAVTLDLVAQLAHIAAQQIDDTVELRIEVIGLSGEASGLFRTSKYRSGYSQQHVFFGACEHRPSEIGGMNGDRVSW